MPPRQARDKDDEDNRAGVEEGRTATGDPTGTRGKAGDQG